MLIFQEFVISGECRALEELKNYEMGVLGNGQEGVKLRRSEGRHIPISHFQVSTPQKSLGLIFLLAYSYFIA